MINIFRCLLLLCFYPAPTYSAVTATHEVGKGPASVSGKTVTAVKIKEARAAQNEFQKALEAPEEARPAPKEAEVDEEGFLIE